MNRSLYLLGAVAIILFVVANSIFIVDERERVLVLQFGEVREEIAEPGLYVKIPFVQNVARYDARILSLETETIEVTPADDRRLLVDAFARYVINDATEFRRAFPTGIRLAEENLDSIIVTQTRAVLGSEGVTSNVILSEERTALMRRIRDLAQLRAAPLGLEVIDVRLRQTNLPDQNLDATFARMRAEREREAIDERARGNEAAQRIRAQADRTVVETLSEAEREGQITRGEADAERTAIFAQAFGEDQEFFEFYRGMTALQTSLQGSDSSLVISPEGDFFEYLEFSTGRSGQGATPASAPASEDTAEAVITTETEDDGEASAAAEEDAGGDDAAEPDTDETPTQ